MATNDPIDTPDFDEPSTPDTEADPFDDAMLDADLEGTAPEPLTEPFDLMNFIEDPKKNEEGTWVKIDPAGGAELLLARWNNDKQRTYLRKMAERYRKQHTVTVIPDKEYREMTIRSVAKYVLLNWRNIVWNKVPVPYSMQKAYEIMLNAPTFYENYVMYQSSRVSNFLKTYEAKVEKN